MINTKNLRRAINSANVVEVTEILRASPKEDFRFANGWTPVHTAVKRGNRDIVAAIVELGADLNATTDMLQTPLDLAVKHGHKPIADLLRKKGARSGAELALLPAVAAGDLRAVRKHVAAGADINQLVGSERPLCLAFERRHWDVANFLLNRKCDVTKSRKSGATPLHAAAAAGAPETLLNKLLKLGADVNTVDSWNWTPLCHAAESGHDETVDWLLDHGADVAHGRESASTPVHCALSRRHVDLASHLIDRGAKSTLHEAVQCNHLARARQQLNAGADPNALDDPPYGQTPLEAAIWQDSTDMVALLLESGADPNQQDRSWTSERGTYGGETSLHDAVRKGSAKMVKLLLAHGADPDIANAEGCTPIQLAERTDRSHLAHLMEAHIDKKLSLAAGQAGIETLYTVQKVAELLSVDDTFILELIKARKITGLNLDEKTLRIPAGSVQRYIAKLSTQQPRA